MKLVIVDIDGTLADFRRRERRAGEMPPREKKHLFQMWLDRLQTTAHLLSDKPIQQVLQIVNLLDKQPGVKLLYLTGRAERYRAATEAWLKKNKAPSRSLYMRGDTDWRQAKIYKKAAIKRLLKKYGVKPSEVLTIDDDGDGDCAAMYRRLGILHLKVNLP